MDDDKNIKIYKGIHIAFLIANGVELGVLILAALPALFIAGIMIVCSGVDGSPNTVGEGGMFLLLYLISGVIVVLAVIFNSICLKWILREEDIYDEGYKTKRIYSIIFGTVGLILPLFGIVIAYVSNTLM